MRRCEYEGCDSKHFGKGLCSKHYTRQYRNGTPDITHYGMDETLEDRFRRYGWEVHPETGCWNWKGATSEGYGVLGFHHTSIRTHRISYSIYKGDIPPGLEVLHSCDNKLCVNPEHLRVGTHRENIQEAVDRGLLGRGADASGAKLSWKDVEDIRRDYLTGLLTHDMIGELYGVHTTTVARVVRGETYVTHANKTCSGW